jgi:hypothetical protein
MRYSSDVLIRILAFAAIACSCVQCRVVLSRRGLLSRISPEQKSCQNPAKGLRLYHQRIYLRCEAKRTKPAIFTNTTYI